MSEKLEEARGRYSTNTRNLDRINHFFSKLGYAPRYLSPKMAASDPAEKVVEFTVENFNPWNLEGELLKEWQALPIECLVFGR